MTNNRSDDDKTRTFVTLSKGTSVGHYKIISRIGAGGMGEVYLAEDTSLHRQVALKFLPAHFIADKDLKARFVREAEAAASLNHPNIITIYEVSEHQGQPFFAMELVEGQSLRDVLKGKELDIERIIELAIQICDGLGAAHDKKVIHRDIKPSNIVIDAYGRPKILDFGLAAIQGGEHLTKTGSTLGTVRYMSPEQVQGKAVDHRSDLFSLGVVLYEMITGHSPFARDNDMAIGQAILSEIPEPLAKYRSNIPDEFQRTISKLLEKDPSMRYQTAVGVISDLKRLIAPAQSTAFATPVQKKSSRRLTKILIPAIVMIIAVTALVLKPWKFDVSPKQEAIAEENRLAIMYFDNLADPEDSQKLGEITANLLITDLSESRYVQVVSSQRLYDILKLLGKEGVTKVDQNVASQVATKARAKWMLMGNILRMEPHIILTAQLVEVASGNVIASQRITGEKDEQIFSLVDKLTIELKEDLSLPTGALQEPDPQVVNISTPSEEAYRYYLDGMNYIYSYESAKAERSFQRAIENDTTFAMAYYGVSLIFPVRAAQLEAIVKAVYYLDRANTREKHFILAQQAALSNDLEKTAQELESIIALYPDEKEAYFRLGRLYQVTGGQKKAIAMYLKVIEIDPLFKEAYNTLSYVYNFLGQFEKSLWAINKYIELDPNKPNPYDSRGDLYSFNGNLAGAIASYQRAVEVDPNYMTSVENLGNMYLIKLDYAKAESLYQVMASHSDKYTRATGRLAMVRIPLYQGRFQQALRIVNIGIETDRMELGEGASLALKIGQRAQIYEYLGEFKSAISDAENSRYIMEEADPNNWFILFRKGYVPYLYAKAGNFSKSDSLVEELERYFEKSDSLLPFIYWPVRGQVALAKKNFVTAAKFYEKSMQLMPFFGPQVSLARCYYNVGRLGDAVATFEKAMRRYDETRVSAYAVKAHYWLGIAYEESGWYDKAMEQYETFLDIWKNADSGLESVEDAKQRLAKLKASM